MNDSFLPIIGLGAPFPIGLLTRQGWAALWVGVNMRTKMHACAPARKRKHTSTYTGWLSPPFLSPLPPSLHLYIHACIYVHTCTNTHSHSYMYPYMHTCTHTAIMLAYMQTFAHACMPAHLFRGQLSACHAINERLLGLCTAQGGPHGL